MYRLLVRFAKLGRLRFISHLDTLEVFRRALRRAGLPVAHSTGAAAQPRLSILHPLPVGTESEAEYLNVELSRRVAPESFRDSLASQMPEGLQIRSVRRVFRKFSFPHLEFTYRVALHGDELPDDDRIGAFLARDSIRLVQRKKGREREEEIRPLLRDIRREGEALVLRVHCVDGKSVRPEDVVRLLLERTKPVRCRVVKTETAYGDR
jgi:radical SAM-linked protein